MTKAARRQLGELGKALTSPRLAKAKFQINGHTDVSGAAAHNKALSAKRARAVKSYLVQRFGIDRHLLATHGWGEERLKDSLDPNNPVNRRVEICNWTRGVRPSNCSTSSPLLGNKMLVLTVRTPW